MANTYVKIASVTVGAGGAANIEFTSIPATYDDLLVKLSWRSTSSGSDAKMTFNNVGTGYSRRSLYSVTTATSSASSDEYFLLINSSAATANTFSNCEIYIPNYAGSTNKSLQADSVTESNDTSYGIRFMTAGLWANTAAISSIKLFDYASFNIAQYSTAVLYGIKKS